MNKKGVGAIGAILLFMIFIAIWFVWLSGWLNEVGAILVATNNMTGLEAFFYGNLNLTVMISMFLGILGWIYFGSQT